MTHYIAIKMAEHAGSESSSPDTDRDFDPSAEMLINDYDDERTLEEEENLSESGSNELDELEKVFSKCGSGSVISEESNCTVLTELDKIIIEELDCMSRAPEIEHAPQTCVGHSKDFTDTGQVLSLNDCTVRNLAEEKSARFAEILNYLYLGNQEGDMPLEDLLAIYGVPSGANGSIDESAGGSSQSYARDEDGERSMMSTGSGDMEDPDSARSSSESEILENQDLTLDKEEIARDLLANNGPADDRETTINDLLHTVASSNTARLLRSNSQPGSEASSDSEEDVDYLPEEDKESKKMIQVGHDYQAIVPEGFCHYGDAPAYENEDRLLWNPDKIDEDKLETYLREVKIQSQANSAGVASIPTGQHVADDEQALYLLLQCGHNMEEALRRRKMQVILPSDPMSLWSEDECKNFETGLRLYGKNFHQIQQYKVRTRAVGELVQFYYMWKKSARHDSFANKNRLEKRKYTLHPGVTDYMDRFLNEQESGALPGTLPGRDRSASPINSLMYGDHKRSTPHLRQDLDEVSSTTMGPLDLPSLSTGTTTTLHTPGSASTLRVESSQYVVGSSATTTCVASSSKRAFEPDASIDSSGGVGLRGSDLNGNTEDSEVSEPVCKKLKVDSSESGVGVEQQADSSSSLPPTSTKLLDSLAVSNISSLDSISSTVLKASELPSASEAWGQPSAGSVGL